MNAITHGQRTMRPTAYLKILKRKQRLEQPMAKCENNAQDATLESRRYLEDWRPWET